MRRRLTWAMTLMVVATLVITGVVTLVFTVVNTRQQTRRELLREAQGLAVAVQQEASSANRKDPAASLHSILQALKSPFRLQGEAVLAFRSNGALFDPANPLVRPQLPSGLSEATIEPAALMKNQTVSGISNSVVFAAVPYSAEITIRGTPQTVLQVVILTRSPPTGVAAAGLWLLVSAGVIILAAVAVAYRLGRRFVRPLDAAQVVTRRIAAGDMDARVPEPAAGTDPELAALVRSVNVMSESLARARGAERQFLLSVSHELRTPLTSIRGYAEAICDGAVTDYAGAGAVIAGESRRLERLVKDLLDLSKLEARRFSLSVVPIDVGEEVAAAVARVGPTATALALELSVDTPPQGKLSAMADRDRLAQVIGNLLENALKYAHIQVRIGTASSEGHPVIWIDDDGPGIAADDLPHVFERQWRSQHQAGRQVGSGLGLAIVAELVEAMGGSVRAESPAPEGVGTRMVVTLRRDVTALPDSVGGVAVR